MAKLLLQHRLRDRGPLFVQAPARDRPARATIPVGRVPGVTLLTVEVRVHPRPVLVGHVLRCAVRGVPMALASCHRETRSGERSGGVADESKALKSARVIVQC